MEKIEYTPIGVIHSPFKTPNGTPIQPPGAKGEKGQVEIFPEYAEGLTDMEEFSHIFLLYHFHLAKAFSPKVKPFLDNEFRGLFATRAPARPNPIGISVVRLLRVENRTLYVQDIDVVDSTPLLDIKPYVPAFDVRENVTTGWFEKNTDKTADARDDGRFLKD